MMLKAFRFGAGSDRVLEKGAGVAFLTQVSAVGLGYVAHVFLARWMGVTEYGSYVYALGWAVPLAALGGMGVHMVALRFVPTYAATGEFGLLRGSYRVGASVAFAGGLAAAVVSLAVLTLVSGAVPAIVWWPLTIGAALVPLLSLTHFQSSFLKALKRVGLAAISDVVRPPLLFLGAAALLVAGATVTAGTVLIVLGGILVIVICVQFVLVRHSLPREAIVAKPVTEVATWRDAMGAMLLIEVFQALMVKADILLIGVMMDVDAVAVFGVAARVAGLVGFVVAAVNAMAGPMITELHATGRTIELASVVRTAGNWMLWPSVATAVALAVLAPWVLGLFGADFVEGDTALWILLLAQVAHAMAGPVFVLITFTGFHEHSARIYGYMLLLNLGLNVVGIYLLGIEGAALAALATAVVWSILLHRAVSTNLRLSASPVIALFKSGRVSKEV